MDLFVGSAPPHQVQRHRRDVNNSQPGANGTETSAIRSGGYVQLAEHLPYALMDLVADRAHPIQAQARRVGQVPVEVALARVDRAGVPAAHRDDDVGALDPEFVLPGVAAGGVPLIYRGGALAISTASISSSCSRRNARGYQPSNRR